MSTADARLRLDADRSTSLDCAFVTVGSIVLDCVACCTAIGTAIWLTQVVEGPPVPPAGQRFNVMDWPMTVVGRAIAATSAAADRPTADRWAILPFSKDIADDSPVPG